MGKTFLGVLLAIGAFILLIVVIGGLVPSHEAARNGSNATEAQQAISVSAPKLWEDYHANEVAADNQYKGKRLIVQGMVTSINKDFADTVYVLLSTFNEFESVHADLSSEYQQEAATLQIGQILTVECEGGGMVIGSPVLRNCSILPNSPAPQSSREPEGQTEPESQAQPVPQAEPGPEAVSSQATSTPSNRDEPPHTASNTVTLPVLIYQAPVEYPTEARSMKVQGTVQVVLLVDENGNPQNVTAVRHSGMGLDEAAVEAVKHYTFKPAVDQRTGQNVPAQISVNVQFHLD
jgi:TonB family protein